MKKILITTLISFLSTAIFVSNAYGFGLEEKTGDVSSLQLMGSYNLTEPVAKNLKKEEDSSYGFGVRGTQGYEFFFNRMHGLRLYFDFSFMYLMGKDQGISLVSIEKNAYWVDLGLNLDYRIDFYEKGNTKYGAFAGIGYGYGVYNISQEIKINGVRFNTSSSSNKSTRGIGGGINVQGGVLITTKTDWQFELGVLYKHRDFKTGYLGIDGKREEFPLNNLAAYISMGWKY